MNLVHRRQNLSNCKKCELGQSRKQELTGRLQPKQGCQSDNLSKEIVSRQAIKSCLDKTTASDCWSSVSLSQPLSHLKQFSPLTTVHVLNFIMAHRRLQSPGKSDNHKHYKVFFWGDLEMTRILRSSSLIEITDNKLLFETIQFSHDTQTAR